MSPPSGDNDRRACRRRATLPFPRDCASHPKDGSRQGGVSDAALSRKETEGLQAVLVEPYGDPFRA